MVYSIAIPVLGQARFLSTALSSLQAQTCRFQLAVMDATPDHSVQDVLENYTEILSYRRHGQDSGQSAAIQEGWDHTDGDIVAWLCGDDYYFPYTLAEVDKIFVAHPEVDVVYGDSVFVDQEGTFLRYFHEIDEHIASILQSCCISQPSCFIRRSALNKIGRLDAKLHYIMDWDLWIRLYKVGAKFFYLRKPLSVVRMYSETKTASGSKERYAEINRLLKCNVAFYPRIRTLAGFYYSDLPNKKKTVAETILFHGLNLLRSLKKLVCKSSRKCKKVLYGFESFSNMVYGECEILLPWYSNHSPRQIVIDCRTVQTLDVYINGCLQQVASLSPSMDSCRYVVQVNGDLISNLIKLNFRSHSNTSWQLISLNIS
jgi:glycosyltransferase involved in cell wall biosynthesis